MGSGVPFQVECVVEALAAECAEVAFQVGMAFCVPIQQPLQVKTLRKKYNFWQKFIIFLAF